VWSTHGGNGSTSQYGAFPTNTTDFGKFFDTAYSNSTLHSQGFIAATTILNWVSSATLTSAGISIPNSGDYFAVRAFGTFIPSETGTYTFTAESDDSVDLFINNTLITSFYGGRGTPALGTTTGTISLTAGVSYSFLVRTQEYAGGEGLRVYWKKPSESGGGTWYQHTNEIGRSGGLGPIGAQGSQGATGNTGAQGSQGAQGPQGSQGAAGNKGIKGITGDTNLSEAPIGAQGAAGNKGVQGAQGSIGVQGAAGNLGAKGNFGTKGDTGVGGNGGLKGEKGNILAGGFFEWNDSLNKLTFKKHGWQIGDQIWIIETYISGSY
jgi:hypothetical protein